MAGYIGKSQSVVLTNESDTLDDVTARGATTTNNIDVGTVTADGLTVDTNTLHVDATNNRVGIGTTSPDHLLTISATTSPVLELEQTSGGPYKTNIVLNGNDTEFRGSSGNIEFFTGSNDGASSTERMRIDASGRVGIGGASGKAWISSDANVGYFGGDSGQANHISFYDALDLVRIYTAGSERLRIDSSGNLKFNSGYGSVATAYGCRAWIQFNMSTRAIANSGGVTSITDIAVGHFRVNLSTATPDANYSVQVSDNYGLPFTETYTTSNFRVKAYNSNFALRDSTLYMAAMFR